MRTLLSVAACAALLLTGCDAVSDSADASVVYAHESNNQAELSGDGVTGTATVNYAKGAPSEWRSSVNVQGDLAAGTYTFFVDGPGGKTAVCTFAVGDGGGRQGCSADTDLGGFATATVEGPGGVVASGTFVRRGGTRETGGKGGQPLSTTLTGAAEVPGPGDPDGSGTAAITLNRGQGKVCFEISVSDIAAPTAAHIHEAPDDASGPVVVGLFMGAGSPLSGCVSADRDLIAEIAAAPSDYYVNVHNGPYPAGAVRGQLGQ